MPIPRKRPRSAGAMKRFRFRTLRTRLIVLVGLPLLLLQIAFLGLEYALSRGDGLDEAKQHFGEVTRSTAAQIDRQLAVIAAVARDHADFIADHPQLGDYDRYRLLRRLVANHPLLQSAALVLEPWITQRMPKIYRQGEGQRLETTDLNRPDYDVRRQAWYRRARSENRGFWIRPADDTALVTYVAPISRSGGFAGLVTVDLPVETLRPRFPNGGGREAHFSLVDGAGTPLASGGGSPVAAADESGEAGGRSGHAGIAGPGAAAQEGSAARSGTGNAVHWLLQAGIPATGWTLVTTVDERLALRGVRSRVLRQVLLQGLGTAGVLLLLWWVAEVTMRPLQPLKDAARQVAEGNLDTRVRGPVNDDEIGGFSMVFNQMMVDLEARIAKRVSNTAAERASERELAIGARIQQSLLPKPFSGTSAVGIAGELLPVRSVAADYYDWFQVDADTVALTIADVSGKGVPAALFMAAVRTALRSSGASLRSPAETLTALNRSLLEDNPLTMFLTVFYGYYHPASGKLVYANAGHNPPYLVTVNGAVEPLGGSTGPVLAVLPEIKITEAEAHLAHGDALVLYTDGVIEASDPDGRPYDEKRLEMVLKQIAGETPKAICERIAYTVADHCRGVLQDDVALLVLRRNA